MSRRQQLKTAEEKPAVVEEPVEEVVHEESKSPAPELDAAVETAADAVRAERATLQRWRDSLAASESELAEADAASTERALADPERAAEVARELAELRETVKLRGRAAVAQEPRVAAAECVYVGALADRLEVDLEAARVPLAEHRAKIDGLLEQLRDLEGEYVPASRLRAAQRAAGLVEHDGPGDGVTYTVPKTEQLRWEVRVLERHVQVLRTMAAGEDPGPLVSSWGNHISTVPAEEAYPASVREPDALVQAPVFAERVETQRALVADMEASLADFQRQEQELEDSNTSIHMPDLEIDRFNAKARWVSRRLEDLPGEIEAARAELAAMGG